MEENYWWFEIDMLPDEIWVHILLFLKKDSFPLPYDLRTIRNFSLVCKKSNEIIKANPLWYFICESFSDFRELKRTRHSNQTWKEICRNRLTNIKSHINCDDNVFMQLSGKGKLFRGIYTDSQSSGDYYSTKINGKLAIIKKILPNFSVKEILKCDNSCMFLTGDGQVFFAGQFGPEKLTPTRDVKTDPKIRAIYGSNPIYIAISENYKVFAFSRFHNPYKDEKICTPLVPIIPLHQFDIAYAEVSNINHAPGLSLTKFRKVGWKQKFSPAKKQQFEIIVQNAELYTMILDAFLTKDTINTLINTVKNN